MFKIDLLRLSEGINPLEMAFSGDIPFFSELDIALESEGTLEGTIEKREENLFILACQMSVPVILTCRRCLEIFTEKIQAVFTTVVVRREGKDDNESVDDDVLHIRPTQEWLDMEDVLREHFILNLPAHPLCKEECKGLCPGCGVDLNSETCNCMD